MAKTSTAERETAETMAGKQKEIAVSEFFAKNRHLLGFDNPRKALLTTVKEAVDNSLDACEEGQILPELWIIIEAINGGSKAKVDDTQPKLVEGDAVSPSIANATRFKVTVRDNGPGIVKAQIPNVFGRLLYGSKFHRLRMSRGQQGIGISAAGMYGLLTTGTSVVIVSRTGKKKPAHHFELQMDTQKNRPEIIVDKEMAAWTIENNIEMEHGTEVSITLEARFQRGRASVDEYLEQTAIANPHALIHYTAPDGVHRDFPREVNEVPPSPKAIKPHPYGVELGVLIRMLKETDHKHLGVFLQEEFSRVTHKVAVEIVEKAGLTTGTWSNTVARDQADRLHKAISETKIIAPPTDCLVPIGPQQILARPAQGDQSRILRRRDTRAVGLPRQSLPDRSRHCLRRPTRRRRFRPHHPLRQSSAASLSTFGLLHHQEHHRHQLAQLRRQPATQRPPRRPVGHLRPHGFRLGSFHQREQGSHRRLRRNPQGDQTRRAGVRAEIEFICPQAPAHRPRGRAPAHFRALHRRSSHCLRKDDRCQPKKLFADLHAISKSRTATADVELDEDGNPIKPSSGAKPKIDENVVVIEAVAAETPAIALPEPPGRHRTSAPSLLQLSPARQIAQGYRSLIRRRSRLIRDLIG